ncbi:MAG: glycosyltransferase family 2 protein, partial [Desulfovibrio sp.]|nr:glycosyltransferase family 2 protein [Desulfovibrio sp.]
HLYEGFSAGHATPRKKRPLQAITGAAMLLRKSVFMDCGGFYEEYRNGFEDMDLCCELRARGYTLAVAGESVVVHHASQTPGRFDHNSFNGELLMRRHKNNLKPDIHTLAALDGYQLEMGPDLDLWLVLPEAREAARSSDFDAHPSDVQSCRNLLEQEPLWRGGWYRLMDMLEAQGSLSEALLCATRCAMFFGDAVSRERLLALTDKAEGPESAAALRAALDSSGTAEQAEAISSIFRQQAEQAMAAAHAREDGLLVDILQQWLVRYGRS